MQKNNIDILNKFISSIKPYNRLGILGIEIVIRNIRKVDDYEDSYTKSW